MLEILDRIGGGQIINGGAGRNKLLGTSSADAIFADSRANAMIVDIQSGRFSGIAVNGETLGFGQGEGRGYRGHIVLVKDGDTGEALIYEPATNSFRPATPEEFQLNIFDTWFVAADRIEYPKFLAAIPDGALVVDVIGDDGGYVHSSFRNTVVPLLEEAGSEHVAEIGLRDAHIFSFVKGGDVIDEQFVGNSGLTWSLETSTFRVNPADFGASPSGAGADTVNAGGGDDLVYGDGGADLLRGVRGSDTLYGGAGSDTLIGGAQSDRLFGDGGTDRVKGGAGDDLVSGGGRNDTVFGGGGNDTLLGGRGKDELYGGGGQNQFVFTHGDGRDIIDDFRHGKDIISFVDSANSFDDIKIRQRDGDVLIRYEDVRIFIEDDNVSSFSASDFIFG